MIIYHSSRLDKRKPANRRVKKMQYDYIPEFIRYCIPGNVSDLNGFAFEVNRFTANTAILGLFKTLDLT
tara:strand:- start:275 stop:481 length:207 start_codon:yes stop_codon:yes gene_type:complete